MAKKDEDLIKDLDSLTPEEFDALMSVLQDETGTKYAQLWAEDYEEIPVDIHTFITDRNYLGSSLILEDGTPTLYDYWIKKLDEIWAKDSGIWEVAFSGAIGIGKSTIAVICMAYMLYKLLCLKNPTDYYKLTGGSKIALAFFNLGIDQVYGVAYSKLQGYLKASPWFLAHGKLWGRKGHETYYPGKNISIVCGSSMEHFIGRDVFCLDGNTLVKTEDGDVKIKDLIEDYKRVYTSDGKLTEEPLKVIRSGCVTELIEIELEDGTIIKCTPEHRFMLADGTYKMAKDLTEFDDIKEVRSE